MRPSSRHGSASSVILTGLPFVADLDSLRIGSGDLNSWSRPGKTESKCPSRRTYAGWFTHISRTKAVDMGKMIIFSANTIRLSDSNRLPSAVQFPEDCIRVLRSRPFRFSARSCNKWSHGRVALCGDSAHVFPPCR